MKKSAYYYKQRDRQASLLTKTNIFEEASCNGIWWDRENNTWGKECAHILQHPDSLKNLFAPIRQEVLSYFEEYDIAWWRADEDRYFPTGNLLSSQIHCLNHLFAIRKDEKAVLSVIQKICPDIKTVLPSPIDWHEYVFENNQPKKIDSYISFEFIFNNTFLLKERSCKRGKNCTSIDAFVYAEDKSGKYLLIPIEWKYTESYEKTKEFKAKEYVVNKRYKELANREYSNLCGWKDMYYWDPLYEFARQTLLMEQIIYENSKGAFPIKADNYCHVIVRPNENFEIIDDIRQFKNSVKNAEKIIEIDPQSLLSPLESNAKYKDLITYLKTRYW